MNSGTAAGKLHSLLRHEFELLFSLLVGPDRFERIDLFRVAYTSATDPICSKITFGLRFSGRERARKNEQRLRAKPNRVENTFQRSILFSLYAESRLGLKVASARYYSVRCTIYTFPLFAQ